MRRFAFLFTITVAAAAVFSGTTTAQTPCQGTCFFWTLSFSPNDPYVHTAPAVPGTVSVYLWYVCPGPETEVPGLGAAEFAVQTSGGLSITGFSPTSGFYSIWTPPQLLLAVYGCPQGPTPAGTFTMLDASGTGGSACFANDVNELNISIDCMDHLPDVYSNRYRGVSTDGSIPCSGVSDWGPCGPVAVEPTPWGSMKALYR